MNQTSFDNLLAIDTSGSNLRLGLSFGGDRLIKSDDPVEKSHGQVLIKKIGELLSSAALTPQALHGMVVCSGPGSFTGLRVGMATAKGMAVALGIEVVGINLFEIAAHKLAAVDSPVMVVIPLRKTEFALMPVTGEAEVAEIKVVGDQQFSQAVGDGPIAGIGLDWTARFPDLQNQDVSGVVLYDAGDLIELGRRKFEAGKVSDLAALEPLYVQKSQAEINFELRNRS